MPDPLRIAVIGAGAFGRNHLRVLHELSGGSGLTSNDPPSRPNGSELTDHPPAGQSASATPAGASQPAVQLVAAVDLDPAIRATTEATYDIPTFASVTDLLEANLHLTAATVAAPTVSHARIAAHLLSAGLDVLIEKPLTATLDEADHLIDLAARHGRILAAGHLERFNPAVTAALARLTRPMFFEAHRLSIFTPRSLDVDVVLDLMIHDLDILLTMANSPVTEVRAVGLPILSPKTDIANVRLEFASGAVANLTASRVSTEQVRKLRLFQPAEYLSLDYARQELLTIQVSPTPPVSPTRPGLSAQTEPGEVERLGRAPASLPSASQPPAATPQPSQALLQPHPSTGLSLEKSTLPRVEPLRLELEDFLHAIATRTAPRVTALDARNALALALHINEAIAAHARHTGL